jgi:hypothetical protein
MGVVSISPKESTETFRKYSTCEATFGNIKMEFCSQCGGSQFVTLVKPKKKRADVSIVRNLVALLLFGVPSILTSILYLILGFSIWFEPFFWAIIGLIINSTNFDQSKSKLSIQNIGLSLNCLSIIICIIIIAISLAGTYTLPFT